jgi:triacylglycerol lipase
MLAPLLEDASGSAQNARFLGKASELAYLPVAAGKTAFSEQLGLTAELISVDNTQAYVAENPDHIVVAFRGTESPATLEGLKDWLLTDAVNLLILPQGRLGTDLAAAGVGARFHQGFVDALDEVWAPLFQAVKAATDRQDRPVWVTGHSLGGALAQLSSWVLQRQFISVHQVVTFGGPMIGNKTATQAYDKDFAGRVFRYVNVPDPVPMLPTVSLIANDYQHCQKEILLGQPNDAASAVKQMQSFAGRAVNGLVQGTLLDDLWNAVISRVEAHLMPSYHKLLDVLK